MTKPQTEPICTEVVVSSSIGGKVEIVKYENYVEYLYKVERKYEVPPGWTEQDVTDFQQDKAIDIRGQIEVLADAEMEELMKQRDELS